jgi:hypothetical protein
MEGAHERPADLNEDRLVDDRARPETISRLREAPPKAPQQRRTPRRYRASIQPVFLRKAKPL